MSYSSEAWYVAYNYQPYQYQAGLKELAFVGWSARHFDDNRRCFPNTCPNMIRGKTYGLQVLGLEPATIRVFSLGQCFLYPSLAWELHNGTTISDR